jgi:polysaccharide biosynthesis protein PelA
MVLVFACDPHRAAMANDAWVPAPQTAPPLVNQPRARANIKPRQPALPRPAPTTSCSKSVAATDTRKVLALYDSTQEATTDTSRIHRFLEFPLNHLGLTVNYWDLAKGLPSASLMQAQRAVITWFSDQVSNSAAYLKWATNQAQAGTRFVVLESVGSSLMPADLPRVNAFTKQLGVEFSPRWIPPQQAGSVISRDDRMVNFESDVTAALPGYMVIAPAGPTAKSHLVIRSVPNTADPEFQSAVVVSGAGGGYAAAGFVFRFDQKSQRLSWIINPFAFLTSALDLKLAPIPDTTTIAGRRLYFSHIDGDGWNGLVNFHGATPTVAEVVLDELIAPYPGLPVSVGLIAADAEPALGGQASARETGARLFGLPHVEVASHTHTHPFRWSFFERYNRQRELGMVLAKRAIALHDASTRRTQLQRLTARNEAVRNWLVSQDYSDGLPRARLRRAFDLQSEVAGALAAATRLAPEGKRAALYLWSGNTRPFESAIRATRQSGVRNMNGGDARFDQDYPSIMYLPPVGRLVGKERQIYAVNSNEHTYTNDWRGPYDGQIKLAQTWDNTDLPTRFKGMNLYYHMYSAGKPESLNALKYLLERVLSSKVIPIEASRYAAIADGFYEVQTTQLSPMKWRISERGALQTVRFDNAAAFAIDWSKSQGVLGFNRHANALYVALDDAVPDAVVALTATPSPTSAPTSRAYLVESQWSGSNLRLRSCGFDLDVQGYGPGEMTWAGVRPGDYQVSFVSADGSSKQATLANVEQDGQLKFTLAANALRGGRLAVACGASQ